MWCLDPVNSGQLITQLRPHARDGEFDVAWVGDGWRPLAEERHRRLSAAFPAYELLAIKQKYGALEYQAFPRPWVKGQTQWSPHEAAELHAIPEEFQARSAKVCEWCGADAQLRDWH